jgi:hypothetical protein
VFVDEKRKKKKKKKKKKKRQPRDRFVSRFGPAGSWHTYLLRHCVHQPLALLKRGGAADLERTASRGERVALLGAHVVRLGQDTMLDEHLGVFLAECFVRRGKFCVRRAQGLEPLHSALGLREPPCDGLCRRRKGVPRLGGAVAERACERRGPVLDPRGAPRVVRGGIASLLPADPVGLCALAQLVDGLRQHPAAGLGAREVRLERFDPRRRRGMLLTLPLKLKLKLKPQCPIPLLLLLLLKRTGGRGGFGRRG